MMGDEQHFAYDRPAYNHVAAKRGHHNQHYCSMAYLLSLCIANKDDCALQGCLPCRRLAETQLLFIASSAHPWDKQVLID